MRFVKFVAEYTHQINDRVSKTWPAGWPQDLKGGEVDDDVAFGARRAGAALFASDAEKEGDEAWFVETLKDVKAKEEAVVKAAAKAAAAAKKAAGEGSPENPPAAGIDAASLI
jgi:hypothetical protein